MWSEKREKEQSRAFLYDFSSFILIPTRGCSIHLAALHLAGPRVFWMSASFHVHAWLILPILLFSFSVYTLILCL